MSDVFDVKLEQFDNNYVNSDYINVESNLLTKIDPLCTHDYENVIENMYSECEIKIEETDIKAECFSYDNAEYGPISKSNISSKENQQATSLCNNMRSKNVDSDLSNYEDDHYLAPEKWDDSSDTTFSDSDENEIHLQPTSQFVKPKKINIKYDLLQNNQSHSIASEIVQGSVPFVNKEHISEKDFCPLCLEYVGHFSRHLFTKHEDDESIKKIKKMPVKSNNRRNAIIELRKKGNFILNHEKEKLNPVRKPNLLKKNTQMEMNIDYFPCIFCLGYYKKKYLWRHKKICKSKLNNEKEKIKKPHLSEAQTLLAMTGLLGNYLSKSRLRKEVLDIMKPDKISLIAKNDPLICFYGESHLNKYKPCQMGVVVSNKMREISRLKLALQKTVDFKNLIEVLKPEMYNHIIAATKLITGYDPEKNIFRASSLALHLGTNLKLLCDVARKAIITENPLFPQADRKQLQENLLSLRELISKYWCNDISRLAYKVPNENKCEKPKLLPLTEDILIFNNYISNIAEKALEELLTNENISVNYKILVECTLALVVVFNRKHIGEVQFLKIENYINQSITANQNENLKSLSVTEKIISGSFKRVVVFDIYNKPVPLLFTKKMQGYIEFLLKTRKTNNIVPQSNNYVFANSGSDQKWINGATVLRKFSQKCGAKNPELLTSTTFKKQVATILQIMHFGTEEVEKIARFMGRTEKTDKDFYTLTEDVHQMAKFAKVLLLLNAGKGSELRGENLVDIDIEDFLVENVIDKDREVDNRDYYNEEMFSKQIIKSEISDIDENSSSFNETSHKIEINREHRKVCEEKNLKNNKGTILRSKGSKNNKESRKRSTRVRWTKMEKKLVLHFFKDHIKKKVAPKKHECEKFILQNLSLFQVKDWVRIKTLVFNTYRNIKSNTT